jgi:amidohydrolase
MENRLTANIHPEIKLLSNKITAIRREIHQHPELGFEEFRTSKLIANFLRKRGILVEENVGKTGVVGLIKGLAPGPTIAFRADMDALTIQEKSKHNYISLVKGKMHACGHDGHVAMLLGVAEVLSNKSKLLAGNVKFIFQPAEEGGGGARFMIEDGCLDGVDEIYGMHLWNFQKFGTFGIKPGPVMASADKFNITVNGTGGHGAAPQGTVDAIMVSSHLVMALQTIVSRNINPLESAVVSVGKINGGSNFNIITDSVELEGTARAYTEENRSIIKYRMQEICSGIARTYGAKIDLDYIDGYPPTINNERLTNVMREAGKRVVGENTVEPFLSMGGEDFSYYAQKIPASFGFVGSAPKNKKIGEVPHHHPEFDFEEDAMLIGASIFLEIIDKQLISKRK